MDWSRKHRIKLFREDKGEFELEAPGYMVGSGTPELGRGYLTEWTWAYKCGIKWIGKLKKKKTAPQKEY